MDEPRAARAYLVPATAGLVLVVVALAVRRLGDPDLGWHLATGRAIWSAGRIPDADTLAFTHAPVRYTVVASDLLLFATARAFGPLGLQILGGLAVAAMGVVLHLTARGGPAGLLFASLAVAATNTWLAVRPAELSYGLLAVALLVFDLHRRGPKGRALYVLPPLFFVWANAHGFVAAGAAALVAYAAYRTACRLARGRAGALLPERDGTEVKRVAIVAALSLAFASFNTAGPRLLLGPYRFDEELAGITEWAPSSLSLLVQQEPAALFLAVLALAGLAFGREHGARAPSAFDAAITLFAVALLVRTTRMIPIAAIVIAPIAARRLAFVVPQTRIVSLAAGLATLAPGGLMLVAPVTSLGVGFEPSLLPVAATEWVREARPLGRMWNFWPFGGYLAWELGTEHEVFMDGRNTLARDRELVMRANRSIVDRAAFEALVEDYGIEWAISSASPADPRSGAGVAHDRRFAMTYLDDVAAVYVRSDGPNAELAGRGYRILRHDMPPETVVAIATGGGDAANALAHDGALAAAQAPASRRGAFLDACGALAAHDDDRFAAALARLERLGGDRALAAALRQIHGYD